MNLEWCKATSSELEECNGDCFTCEYNSENNYDEDEHDLFDYDDDTEVDNE